MPSKPLNLLVVVLYINNPAAGVAIKSLCAVVIRGGKKPFVVLCKSTKALVATVITLPSVKSLTPICPVFRQTKFCVLVVFLIDNLSPVIGYVPFGDRLIPPFIDVPLIVKPTPAPPPMALNS